MASSPKTAKETQASTIQTMRSGVGARPVRSPKTAEIVAQKIRAEIVCGNLTEGDTLPPEGALMEELGISRPTLREAFRILEAEKFIEVVRGSRTGAAVHAPQVSVVARYAGYVLEAQKTTIADLYEARLAIEPYVVRRLASKPPKGALARLRDEIETLKHFVAEDRFEDFILHLSEFHRLLVEVGGNQTLTFLDHLLLNLITRHQYSYQQRYPQDRKQREKAGAIGIKSFEKLVSLLEAGDEDGAVAHWRLHLKNAAATWAKAGEAERIVDSLGE